MVETPTINLNRDEVMSLRSKLNTFGLMMLILANSSEADAPLKGPYYSSPDHGSGMFHSSWPVDFSSQVATDHQNTGIWTDPTGKRNLKFVDLTIRGGANSCVEVETWALAGSEQYQDTRMWWMDHDSHDNWQPLDDNGGVDNYSKAVLFFGASISHIFVRISASISTLPTPVPISGNALCISTAFPWEKKPS